MTIVHLTPSYLPAKGGVETHVAKVVELQEQAGYQVVVVTKNSPHTKGATWWFTLKNLPLFLTAEVIQVHDIFWWLLPIYPLLFLARKKIITTFHGWEGQYPVRWQAKLQRWMYNLLSTKVVHVGEWIQEFYWDTPDAVTYGGVESDSSRLQEQVKKNHSPKKLRIIFVGRLEAENEIEKYLVFIRELKKDFNVEISWVGDGDYRTACSKLGTVTGMVSDVASYLVSADLVLASSYLSILEAQALGKVVVALYSHPLKQRYLETFPGSAMMVLDSDPLHATAQVKALTQNKTRWLELETAAAQFAKVHRWSNVAHMYERLFL